MLLSQNSSNEIMNFARLPQLLPSFLSCVSVGPLGNFCKQLAATMSAEDGPGLVIVDSSLKARCPSLRLGGDRRAAACRVLWSRCPELGCSEVDCPPGGLLAELAARWWRVGEGRAGLACSGILMTRLSSILETVAHKYVQSCSVCSAMIAAVSPPRSDGGTDYASFSVQLTKLGHTFLCQWLAPCF